MRPPAGAVRLDDMAVAYCKGEADEATSRSWWWTRMQKDYRIAIVLDESFGTRLLLLAQRLHVWAVDSPANSARDSSRRGTGSCLGSTSRDRNIPHSGSSAWDHR
jgi:hypothetical protein